MIVFGIYILVGFVACFVDLAISTEKKKAMSAWALMDPVMIVAWPIMLVVSAIEGMQPPEKKVDHQVSEPKDYLNKTGTVVVELRPAGKIRVETIVLDARSRFGVIAVGCAVRVVGKELGEHIVEELK